MYLPHFSDPNIALGNAINHYLTARSYPTRRTSTKTRIGRGYNRRGRRRTRGRTKRYYKNKKLQRRRAGLALPPIALKRKVIFTTAANYAAFAAGTWSAYHRQDVLAVGATNTTRESTVIKYLPYTYTVQLTQAASVEHRYRLMMIRVFDNIANLTGIEPQTVLRETGSIADALRSSYLVKEDRGIRFSVIYDKTFSWQITAPRLRTKVIKIKQKANTVTYDTGDATGETAQNKTIFVMLTDATSGNANYQEAVKADLKFLD